jgi:hypothetical protein
LITLLKVAALPFRAKRTSDPFKNRLSLTQIFSKFSELLTKTPFETQNDLHVKIQATKVSSFRNFCQPFLKTLQQHVFVNAKLFAQQEEVFQNSIRDSGIFQSVASSFRNVASASHERSQNIELRDLSFELLKLLRELSYDVHNVSQIQVTRQGTKANACAQQVAETLTQLLFLFDKESSNEIEVGQSVLEIVWNFLELDLERTSHALDCNFALTVFRNYITRYFELGDSLRPENNLVNDILVVRISFGEC